MIKLKPATQLLIFRSMLLVLLLVISWLAFIPIPKNSELDIGYDKFNHLLAFFTLAWCCYFSFPGKQFIRAIFIPLTSYAILIECIQYFLPYRTFSLVDILADLIGILLYFLISKYWLINHAKAQQKL